MKLLQAVQRGTLDQIRDIIDKNGLPVDSKWSDYQILYAAFLRGRIDVAKLLIEKGCRINGPQKSYFHNHTPLHWAVIWDDIELVDVLLNKGAWIDIKNFHNKTPVHLAWINGGDPSCSNADDILDKLFTFVGTNCRDNINPSNRLNFTLFHMACIKKRLDLVKFFLEQGVDVNEAVLREPDCGSYTGFTPLHFAVYYRSKPLLEMLFQYNADTEIKQAYKGRTPLHMACELPILKSTFSSLNFVDKAEESLTRLSEEKQDVEIIKLLLSKKSNVNAKDNDCNATPLMSVCRDLHFMYYWSDQMKKSKVALKNKVITVLNEKIREILNLFIDHNLDLNIADKYGRTMLHFLIIYNSDIKLPWYERHYEKVPLGLNDVLKDIYTIILKNGANINALTNNGESLLYLSISQSRYDITQFLLNQGADPKTVTTKDKYTTLHKAMLCSEINKKLIHVLLKKRVDIDAKSLTGKTVLHMLSETKRKSPWQERVPYNELIRLFLRYDCDIDAQDNRRRTPLHVACLETYGLAIRYLLNYGADINVQDNKGETALFYCIRRNYRQGCKILVHHIKKLQILGLHVNKENLKCLTKVGHLYIKGNKFENDCKREIIGMRAMKLDLFNSLYDLIFKGPNQLIIHTKQDKMKNIIFSTSFNKQYPNYGYLLNIQYRRGLTRGYLLDSAKKALNSLIKIGLPDCCSEQIFRYLRDRSLKSLIDAEKLTL